MNDERRTENHSPLVHRSALILHRLLGLFVRPVTTAASAELVELKSLRRRLLVLRRHVVAALALGALKHDVVAWHKLTPKILSSNAAASSGAAQTA
jgi:hypothetical protein